MKKPTKAQAARYLRQHATQANTVILRRFFKTGPGEYGEGDRFLGVKMPHVREAAKIFSDLPEKEHAKLLSSPFHEERMLALILWSERSETLSVLDQRRLARRFLQHRHAANNWDLIDVTVPEILGPLMLRRERVILGKMRRLIRSPNLWDRRIALLSTFPLIRNGDFEMIREFATLVLGDSEDLIHKATGWMLREMGKRDVDALRGFLRKHAGRMPRTMLRYAIEKLSVSEQRRWRTLDRPS